MESKRLGLTRKAMIVVPNHITSQWNMSALAAYPGANILAPTPADLSKSKRGEFLSRVATNDWDIIIVPFSSFKLLPVSAETQSDFYQREIDTLFDYLSELKADKSPTRAIKEIEKSIKRFQVKLDTLADMRKDDDKTITWEELGISPGDDSEQEPYLVEAWICRDGKLTFVPIGAYYTETTIVDEPGCSEPSFGRVYGVEKHGYTKPREIPWPQAEDPNK
jgi:hypothetical protein